jgi:hypothetical protein
MINSAIRALTLHFKVALLTFLLGIATASIWMGLMRDKGELRVILPDQWGPEAFRIVDERAGAAQLPKLRTVLLLADDLEVRIWVGGGTHGEDGLVLQRSAGRWSAIYLEGMFDKYPPAKYQEAHILSAPKSGWETTWQRLIKAGILSLPDESERQCETFILDSTDYLIEINTNGLFRAYSYGNPSHASCA